MGQIILNDLFVFVVPFLIGTAVRLLCRRTEKAWLAALILAVLAVIAWAAACIIPSHGSELYGIIALAASSMAVGALLAGLIMRLKRN